LTKKAPNNRLHRIAAKGAATGEPESLSKSKKQMISLRAPIQILILQFLMFIFGQAHLANDYGPFGLGAEPKIFPITELAHRLEDSNSFGRTENSPPLIQFLRGEEESSWSIVICNKDGKSITKPVKVSSMMIPNCAYVGDLNRDGKPDYIIQVFSGGNGIPPSDLVFAISEKTRYVITVFRAYDYSRSSFVDLRHNGQFQYIQTIFVFVSNIKGKDGKSHNYWVHNIYSLSGASFELNNSMQSGFPKWILFTDKSNHKPTNQLTEEQKIELWKLQAAREKCLIWMAGDKCAEIE
jgi:hypothetical protein